MIDFLVVIAHFIGNIFIWIINFGSKSIDEVSKEDNSIIGFIILIILGFVFYSFKK